jgi:hypothetical protein
MAGEWSQETGHRRGNDRVSLERTGGALAWRSESGRKNANQR